MRRGEILKLRWADVDFSRGLITVTHTKTGKDRTIPMNRVARDELLQLQQASGDHGCVFVSPRTGGQRVEIKRAWASALAEAEIENFRFHDLRHTTATRLADAGADAFTIAAILGHATIQMSARYTHATDEAKRRAVERIAEAGKNCLNFVSKHERQTERPAVND
jgi:integrase